MSISIARQLWLDGEVRRPELRTDLHVVLGDLVCSRVGRSSARYIGYFSKWLLISLFTVTWALSRFHLAHAS